MNSVAELRGGALARPMRKAKHFRFTCTRCNGAGLAPHPLAPYGVDVCIACGGSGRRAVTILQRID